MPETLPNPPTFSTSANPLSSPTFSGSSETPVIHAGGTVQSVGTPDRPSGGVDPTTADKCVGFIKEFEDGTRSKMLSWLGIQSAIASALGGDENKDRRYTALDFYYKLLEDADAKLRDIDKPETTIGKMSHSRKERKGKKRARAISPEDKSSGEESQGSAGEDSSGDEHSLRREKVDKRLLAWRLPWGTDPFPSKSVSDKNRLTFANWRCDPSLVKSSAFKEPDCPEFPDSEWTNHFKGKPVDFDVLISSTVTFDCDSKQSIKLGEGELKFGHKSPAKRVKTHGDWTIAWDMYGEVLDYTMPWRRHERQEYWKYISGLFKAYSTAPSAHINVINFDKAVRQRVSMSKKLLLSDTPSFQDLYIAWITNGAGSNIISSPSTSNPIPRQRKRLDVSDICRRWNVGKCPDTARNCRYIHICNTCRSGEHAGKDSDCPQKGGPK